MNKIVHTTLILFILLFSNCIYSQDEKRVTEILSKSESIYKTSKNLAINMNYKLYTSYLSNKISESYNGKMFSQNKSTYIKIHNTEFLQTETLSLKINHDQKMLVVFKNSVDNSNMNPMNITGFLKNFKSKKIIDKGTYWICTLQTGKYTQMMYGKVELYINKKNYKIEKQILYLLEKAMFKDSKGIEKYDFPRLEITINDLDINEVDKKTAFDIKTYIIKEGNQIKPSKKYSNYTLHKN